MHNNGYVIIINGIIMSRVQVDNMVIFARVAEAQSFTRAASALGIPISTVSRRVARLEESLGVSLLHRTTRKLSLTDIGAAYAERCLAIRAEVEEANSAVSSASVVPRGTLRVTSKVGLSLSSRRPAPEAGSGAQYRLPT